MQDGWKTLGSLARLMRPQLAATAVSNIWFAILWRGLVEGGGVAVDSGLPAALALSAGVAIGLYVFGACLNDVLDQRRDRLFAPQRPLPSRTLTRTQATVAALVGLLVGLFCAVGLGPLSMVAALVCASLIVGYNTLGKFLPAVGFVLLGLIRLTLMASGAPELGFWWPGCLAMTHMIVIAGLAHWLSRKRPRLAPQEVWIIAAGWAFLTLGLIVWMSERGELAPDRMPGLWLGPLAAGIVALLALAATLRWRPSDRWAGRMVWGGGMAWLIVYDGSWFLAAGQWRAAAIFGGLLLVTLTAFHAERLIRVSTDRSEMYPADRGAT